MDSSSDDQSFQPQPSRRKNIRQLVDSESSANDNSSGDEELTDDEEASSVSLKSPNEYKSARRNNITSDSDSDGSPIVGVTVNRSHLSAFNSSNGSRRSHNRSNISTRESLRLSNNSHQDEDEDDVTNQLQDMSIFEPHTFNAESTTTRSLSERALSTSDVEESEGNAADRDEKSVTIESNGESELNSCGESSKKDSAVIDLEDDIFESITRRRSTNRKSLNRTNVSEVDEISSSLIDENGSSPIANSFKTARSRNSNQITQSPLDESIEVPETDDDEAAEESKLHCYSPRTRMSINGRRPKDMNSSLSEWEESDNPLDAQISGSNENLFENIANETAKIKSIKKRNRDSLAQSFALDESRNASVIKTPNAKRSSIHNPDDSFTFEKKQESIMIDSASSNGTGNGDAVVLIDSSSDEDKSIEPFSGIRQSTPQRQKPLFQPKIEFSEAPKMVQASSSYKKYVSQQYFNDNEQKLNVLKQEICQTRDLHARMGPTLPDKGKNLLKRITELSTVIAKQQQFVDNMVVEETELLDKPTEDRYKLPSWQEIEAGTSNIVPKHTGAQGLHTFNEHKTLALDRLQKLHTALESCPKEDEVAETPYGLQIDLMRHQKHGLAWMLWRENQKPRGGILADDMGLGKTLSVIALILASMERQKAEGDAEDEESSDDDESTAAMGKMPGWVAKGRKDYYYGGTLVVCPASLIEQWEKEIKNRVKRHQLSVTVHHGNNRETLARKLSKNDVVVTTYGLVASELKNEGPLHQIKWERVVLDEAHIIRTHTTAAAIACCHLKGTNRWALTGTPVQNKEKDVYSLLKFLKCTPFDELGIFKKWTNVNTEGGLNRLTNILKPLILRRTKVELHEKGELQSLPEKSMEMVAVKLSMNEMNVYSKILTFSKTLFGAFLEQRSNREHRNNMGYGYQAPYERKKEPNEAYAKMHEKFSKMHGFTGEVKSSQILVLITRLRQICNHPGLIDKMLEDDNGHAIEDSDDEETPEMDLLAELNKLHIDEPGNNNNESDIGVSRASSKLMSRSNPVFDTRNRSSKLNEVLRIIEKIIAETKNDKVVVVSQWTSVLDILSSYLRADAIPHVELNGKTVIKYRNDIVVKFNKAESRERVLLLSLMAGGVGLNLVGANHLVLVDPHWNPQLEAQACDRVYRVGQKKPVVIYKLISDSTIEERIKGLQDAKMAISNQVLTGSRQTNGSKLSFNDIKKLFDM